MTSLPKPPPYEKPGDFCQPTGIFCTAPACEEHHVTRTCMGELFVRDQDTYYEGEEYLALCDKCGARYSVTPEVQPVEFVDPRPLKEDEVIDHE